MDPFGDRAAGSEEVDGAEGGEVAFRADDVDDEVGRHVLSEFFEPDLDVGETVGVRDVVDEDGCQSPSVVQRCCNHLQLLSLQIGRAHV